MQSLTRYLDTMTSNQLAVLEDSNHSAVVRLQALFASVIDVEEGNRREGRSVGCLGVNSSIELSRRDPEVAGLLQRDLERRLAALRDSIAAGQDAGEISRARQAGEFAWFLNAVIAGMRVSAQNGADRAALEVIAASALGALTR